MPDSMDKTANSTKPNRVRRGPWSEPGLTRVIGTLWMGMISGLVLLIVFDDGWNREYKKTIELAQFTIIGMMAAGTFYVILVLSLFDFPWTVRATIVFAFYVIPLTIFPWIIGVINPHAEESLYQFMLFCGFPTLLLSAIPFELLRRVGGRTITRCTDEQDARSPLRLGHIFVLMFVIAFALMITNTRIPEVQGFVPQPIFYVAFFALAISLVSLLTLPLIYSMLIDSPSEQRIARLGLLYFLFPLVVCNFINLLGARSLLRNRDNVNLAGMSAAWVLGIILFTLLARREGFRFRIARPSKGTANRSAESEEAIDPLG